MYPRLQDPDHTELLMQMIMRYPIPGTSSTCTDFTLDPSNMVMSVDLFNKAKVFISFSTTLKAAFNLVASLLPYKKVHPIPTWITYSE